MLGDIAEGVCKAVKGAAHSLLDVAPVKISLAGTLSFFFSSHGTALVAFIVLILLDLMTKWLSLSHKYLLDQGICRTQAGLWQCIQSMKKAFANRYITSEMMKTKFAGKIILYMVLVAAVVQVDSMTGGDGVFLRTAWFYLAATEAVSIVENLRDAGVQRLTPLLAFIRSKLGGLK